MILSSLSVPSRSNRLTFINLKLFNVRLNENVHWCEYIQANLHASERCTCLLTAVLRLRYFAELRNSSCDGVTTESLRCAVCRESAAADFSTVRTSSDVMESLRQSVEISIRSVNRRRLIVIRTSHNSPLNASVARTQDLHF